jgi:hypothetical protein
VFPNGPCDRAQACLRTYGATDPTGADQTRIDDGGAFIRAVSAVLDEFECRTLRSAREKYRLPLVGRSDFWQPEEHR